MFVRLKSDKSWFKSKKLSTCSASYRGLLPSHSLHKISPLLLNFQPLIEKSHLKTVVTLMLESIPSWLCRMLPTRVLPFQTWRSSNTLWKAVYSGGARSLQIFCCTVLPKYMKLASMRRSPPNKNVRATPLERE